MCPSKNQVFKGHSKFWGHDHLSWLISYFSLLLCFEYFSHRYKKAYHTYLHRGDIKDRHADDQNFPERHSADADSENRRDVYQVPQGGKQQQNRITHHHEVIHWCLIHTTFTDGTLKVPRDAAHSNCKSSANKTHRGRANSFLE